MNTTLKKLSFTGLLIMALSLNAVAGNLADEGAIEARGNGSVWVVGAGWAEFDLKGQGTLKVIQRNNLRVTLRGSGTVIRQGLTTRYIDYRGVIRLEGDSMAASFTGGEVQLKARGHAEVILRGEGRYTAGGISAAWDAEGVNLTLGNPGDLDVPEGLEDVEEVEEVEEAPTVYDSTVPTTTTTRWSIILGYPLYDSSRYYRVYSGGRYILVPRRRRVRVISPVCPPPVRRSRVIRHHRRISPSKSRPRLRPSDASRRRSSSSRRPTVRRDSRSSGRTTPRASGSRPSRRSNQRRGSTRRRR